MASLCALPSRLLLALGGLLLGSCGLNTQGTGAPFPELDASTEAAIGTGGSSSGGASSQGDGGFPAGNAGSLAGNAGSGGLVGSSGGNTGSGGTGTGGDEGTGGITGTGGAEASGGDTGTGGLIGAGGDQGSGGIVAAGGDTGPGGDQGTGGLTGAGGDQGSGGIVAAGGDEGTGGIVGAGGDQGTGGSVLYEYKMPLDIPNTETIPQGYSLTFEFDHAKVVSELKSKEDGSDVRVRLLGSDGSWREIDRVLGLASMWNDSHTRIWFRNEPGASQTTPTYALFYGTHEPEPPLQDPDRIFVFWDDFESGDLSKWTQVGNPWSIGPAPDSATNMVVQAPLATDNQDLLIANDIDEGDIVFDASWYLGDTDTMDVAQALRLGWDGTVLNQYESNMEGSSVTANAGWDIAWLLGESWGEFVDQPWGQLPPRQQWTRVSITMLGQEMRVFRDGTQIVPLEGGCDMEDHLWSGSVGFRVHVNLTRWLLDQVRVRKYASPEPEVIPGQEEMIQL